MLYFLKNNANNLSHKVTIKKFRFLGKFLYLAFLPSSSTPQYSMNQILAMIGTQQWQLLARVAQAEVARLHFC
jgi:hypothetical protein